MKEIFHKFNTGILSLLFVLCLVPKIADALTTIDAQEKQSFALLISMTSYMHAWPTLTSRISKVEQLAEVLKETGYHVTRSLNPDSAHLKKTIDTFVKKHSGKNNRLLFFYTGHCFQDNDGNGSLIPSDTPLPIKDTGLSGNYHIPIKSILESFRIGGIERTFFVIDSSTSVTAPNMTLFEESNPVSIDMDHSTLLQIVLGAGSADEAESTESDFILPFIQALKQQSSENNDLILLKSFCKHLTDETEHNRWQIPWVKIVGNISLFDEMIFVDKNQNQPENLRLKKGTLLVSPVPPNATVRILNILPKYNDSGMVLDPGDYKIEISAHGYKTATKWVQLQSSEYLEFNINLDVLDSTADAIDSVPPTPEIPEVVPTQTVEIQPPEPDTTSEIITVENAPAPVEQLDENLHEPALGIDLIKITKGTFAMGGKRYNEGPIHTKTIANDFYIMETEVSVKQYSEYLRATGSTTQFFSDSSNLALPVVEVSWQDAINYAEWLTKKTGREYRLPTEAEWEYVAQKGLASNREKIEYPGKARGSAIPVKMAWRNQLDIYGMPGNVWEWCSDCWVERYDTKKEHETTSCRNRAIRGGSWRDSNRLLTATSRNGITVETKVDNIGFRLVTKGI